MIDFTVPEHESFRIRRRRSILVIVFIIAVMLSYSWQAGFDLFVILNVLSILFFIQMYRAGKRRRYFITHIKIQNDKVDLTYTRKGREKSFTGALAHTRIQKKQGFFSRSKTTCLAIYNNNQLVLKQFIQGEWTEEKFDEIEQYIRNYKNF
jgi:hypothetical protein